MLRTWVTQKLQRGDLRALASVRQGGDPDADSVQRLARRKFVKVRPGGAARITGRGRLALLLRRFVVPSHRH